MIVTDASVVLEVLLRTADGERLARRLFGAEESVHAPHLLDVEVAQVLRRYVARGDVDPERGRAAIELLGRFPLTRHPHEPLLRRVWALRANLTAYDAVYVALAEGLDATLLTRDRKLANAPGNRATVDLV
ncbi:MAG: type II toxin-antitoxin system VapC family toxin [Gemmatimonadales bacterium]